MYEMLTGLPPFYQEINTKQMFLDIIGKRPYLPNWLSFEAQDLLKQLLEKDPTKRPKIDQLIAHKWFKTGSILKKAPIVPDILKNYFEAQDDLRIQT